VTRTASVVIPVKDGARYLAELLRGVREQDDDLEVLVIDSGSRDASVPIARAQGARVLEIPAREFGHGRTRNLGARETSGELICFLTQDATPLPGWLDAMRDGFELGENVGAVFGPHRPRPDTSPMIARELEQFFAQFAPDHLPTVQAAGGPSFLSNVNACYRRVCWETIGFEDVPYSEDQAFGEAMLRAGWQKVYHPAAAVLHAHDYGPIGFMRRYFDEYRGLRSTAGHVEPRPGVGSAKEVARLVVRDQRWMRARGWPAGARARWLPRSAVHHSGRKLFSALGSRAERLPVSVARAISLEGTADEPAPVHVHSGSARTGFEAVLRVARDGAAPLLDPVPGMAQAERLHIAMVIPHFRRGSGGHSTIFELATRLEERGHVVSTWLIDSFNRHAGEWPAAVRGNLREFFRPFSGPVYKDFEHWHGADVVVATGWNTAHTVCLLDGCRARAYLVQDHEPEFFATSAEAMWARDTYALGLFCITAGRWLSELLRERYGARTMHFDLGVDFAAYHPRPIERRADTVIFYAREATPRRGVPLGLLALEELHRRRPDVRIVLFGDNVRLPTAFPCEDLGIASPRTLAAAYCEATVGLSISLTNHSLIPQEMMACGLPVVELDGENLRRVFGEDGPLALAAPDPIALADTLERLLDNPEKRARRALEGRAFVADRSWARASRQFEDGLRASLRDRELGGVHV
jgi:glycosyltransferase involved in cell wall biosynthesis/GT2 family glycosyltransferase